MSSMISDLETYFQDLLPPRDELLLELEAEAASENIPIVGPVVGMLLFILARAVRTSRILEIGTATGYSTLFLARGCVEMGGEVITIERESAMADRARTNFRRAGSKVRIEIMEGEASALLDTLSGHFDMVFLDADKEEYAPLLSKCHRLTRSGGLLVADNVAFQSAIPFNREIHQATDWDVIHLLSYLPGHAPENDAICLAIKR